MTTGINYERVPEGWPHPELEQVQILLLGTYHMDNPGLDEYNLDADNVLAPERQEELRALTDELVEWNPDRIAVERPYYKDDKMNAFYDEFRSGRRQYDREVDDEDNDFRGLDSDADGEVRSEVVQIGFRLAEALEHEQVYAVDDPTNISNDDIEALDERGFEPEQKVEYSIREGEDVMRESQRRLADSTISEFLHWENREEQLRFNHEVMYDWGVRWGEGDNFGGPRVLSAWYDRNIKMVHNLWRALEKEDDKAMILVGSGHVHVLRHLLDESPMFCPVSPLPYLETKE